MIGCSTPIPDDPLASRTQRLAAACEGRTGREILALPLVAARLAGGFITPVATEAALDAGGFRDLGRVSSLPGMPRAVLASLDAVWRADIDLSSFPLHIERSADDRLTIDRE
jgi:hypothetical protein